MEINQYKYIIYQNSYLYFILELYEANIICKAVWRDVIRWCDYAKECKNGGTYVLLYSNLRWCPRSFKASWPTSVDREDS